MFTNQLNQIYNMIRHDLPAEWKAGETQKAMTGLASIMASSMMIYVASHGGAWPDDEEEQLLLSLKQSLDQPLHRSRSWAV